MSKATFVSGNDMLPGDMLTGRIKFLFPSGNHELTTISKYTKTIVLSTLNCDLLGITMMTPRGEITHMWFNSTAQITSDTLYEVIRQ